MSNSDNPVVEQLQGRVLTITLNRPEAKNAITPDLSIRLHEAVTRAAGDGRVGAIVLTGAGDAFCAGGDLKVMSQAKAATRQGPSSRELLELGAATAVALHRMPKPTIAMIRGAAAGGGLALALGCDLRIADESAKFTFAYTNIALSGDFGCAWFLDKWLGPARAREFCLLCPTIRADEALTLGLLNRVHPPGELEQQVYAMAERLANGPTDALGRIKANLDAAADLAQEEYLALEADNFLAGRESPEHGEAVRAFLDKRKPRFHSP
jgi:2-(1,2-epoxy-1,2-dihydrophenyl)acetyl-CoA isomerase